MRPLVDDALWDRIASVLPKERRKPKGGRPRVADRDALTGILFALLTGVPWEYLPQEMGCDSGMTCWRRLRDWQKRGVWTKLHRLLLSELRAADQLDWSRAARYGSSVAAEKNGRGDGPTPTDRGKPGTKRHLVVARSGMPLALLLSGANVHDSPFVGPLLDAIPAIAGKVGHPRQRPTKLHADTRICAMLPSLE